MNDIPITSDDKTTQQESSPTAVFIQRLHQLKEEKATADLARLKRNAGEPLAQARRVHALFFRLLPHGVPKYHEKWYFLVATLFPLADTAEIGSFGRSMRRARQNKSENEKGFDRRFEVLLDADPDQLPFRLRQAVKLITAAEVGVDWRRLLEDLLKWDSLYRTTQKKWARDYYAYEKKEK